MTVTTDFDAPRFTTPILTTRDVANLVEMPLTTVQTWAGQRSSRPSFITALTPYKRGWPSIPLVGLAEAHSLRALRAVLKPRAVPAAHHWVMAQFDMPHPLANQSLVTDGVEAFVRDRGGEVVRLRDGQSAMPQVIQDHLRPLEFGEDDYPVAYNVTQLPGVQIHPRFNAGRMSFKRNRVPLFAVAGLLLAGEPEGVVADEFDLRDGELELVRMNLDWLAQAA